MPSRFGFQSLMNLENWINTAYLLSSILFILGLKLLSSPKTAIKGNLISSLGMFLAILVTLLNQEILDYKLLFLSLFIGSIVGFFFAKTVVMTAMPEMVALLNGFGGIASYLVGWSVFHENPHILSSFSAFTIFLSILIGGVTFSGSMIAWAKLGEKISGRPFLFSGQKWLNFSLLFLLMMGGIIFSTSPAIHQNLFSFILTGSILLGILLVVPIGGADMPVVISLLNSYSGIAACAAGFIIKNSVLIVSGALVGASGIILTSIMCKAMNRSIVNVLFSGFGKAKVKKNADITQKEVHKLLAKDAYHVLEAARSVLIVPGYGLAVAQGQHIIKELSELLEKNGAEVQYAIHSVAGRMPGHMNVLLAEAGIDYEKLIESDAANSKMDLVDVCLVIGANDVVNPSARDDESSSIYGMPIIEADKARNVFILKRSLGSGFAGIENPLFYMENSSLIFGDAKKTLQDLVAEFKN